MSAQHHFIPNVCYLQRDLELPSFSDWGVRPPGLLRQTSRLSGQIKRMWMSEPAMLCR